MVSQYVNIWKSASHVEYCAVKQNILQLYLLCNKKNSIPQVIIIVNLPKKKNMDIRLFIIVTYKKNPLSVKCTCTPYESKNNIQHTRTDNRT